MIESGNLLLGMIWFLAGVSLTFAALGLVWG